MAHKILMVEDDFALAMGTEYALTSEGYAVTTAGNLAQAREKFDDSIDLVLLDVMLPDGTGFEFCKELREKNSDVPIIFLTAVAEEANIVQGLELGADDYVTKPYRVKELLARVAVNIRRYTQARQTSQENSNRGQVISRSAIMEQLYDIDGEFFEDNTLSVYIKRLRQKLGEDGAYIETVRGMGYRFRK